MPPASPAALEAALGGEFAGQDNRPRKSCIRLNRMQEPVRNPTVAACLLHARHPGDVLTVGSSEMLSPAIASPWAAFPGGMRIQSIPGRSRLEPRIGMPRWPPLVSRELGSQGVRGAAASWQHLPSSPSPREDQPEPSPRVFLILHLILGSARPAHTALPGHIRAAVRAGAGPAALPCAVTPGASSPMGVLPIPPDAAGATARFPWDRLAKGSHKQLMCLDQVPETMPPTRLARSRLPSPLAPLRPTCFSCG